MRRSVDIALRPRLMAMLRMTPPASTVADVGCDHGRLAVALYRRGVAKHVIASDISEASLQKAHTLVERYGLNRMIDLVVSDGLSHLKPNEADAIVMGGMGGELIVSMLNASEAVARSAGSVILQPMGGIEELRKYLYTHAYTVFDEALACESGRFYQVLGIRSGTPPPVPDGFPKGYYGIGYVMFEKRDQYLEPMLKKRSESLKRKLDLSALRGHRPEKLLAELEAVDRILKLL